MCDRLYPSYQRRARRAVSRSNDPGASTPGWQAARTVHVNVLPQDSPNVEITADEPTEVVYTPVVDRAAFERTVLSPGGSCVLTIDTAFAGAGCPVRVVLADARGAFQTIDRRVAHSRLRVPCIVPEDAERFVRAEVTLEGAQAPVPSAGVVVLTDPVRSRDIRWSTPDARIGEPVGITAQVSPAADGYAATVRIKLKDPTGEGAHEPITSIRAAVEGGAVDVRWIATVPEEEALESEAIPSETATGDTRNPSASLHPPVLLAEVEVLGVTARSWEGAGRASDGFPAQLRVTEGSA